jgi:nucleoside-triphosphatase THEP1
MVVDFQGLVDQNKKIVLLSGGRGKGKTTTCRKWIDQARESGWSIAGITCPAVFENGEKIGIDAIDLNSGERRHLAWLNRGEGGVVATDHWIFDQEVLKWGSLVLKGISVCDLLVVDEIGPLEFYRKEGWVEAFDAIKTIPYQLAVVVIRPELLEEAVQLWPDAMIVTLDS